MACIDHVAKNGVNTNQHYAYAMATDVYDAVRSELARRFIAIIPSVLRSEFQERKTSSGGIMTFCTLTVRFDIVDGESGEIHSSVIVGSGSDSLDKAPYKAMTGATKNFLINAFLIPTGTDPEAESKREVPPPQGLASVKSQMAQPVAQTGAPAYDRSMSFGFGSGRGTPISSLDEKSLAWYSSCLQRDLVDASKAAWHDKTRQQLATLQAEIKYRARD
jgi:ERF superfamily